MRKEFTLIAGINGAGKSTFYSMDKISDEAILKNSIRVNADEILTELGLDWRNTTDQFTAGKLTAKKLKACEAGEDSFHQETTLAGNAHTFIRRINTVKTNGFYVRLIYIALESDSLAKQRIAERVKKGGHGIPDDIVEKRYLQSLNNVKRIFPLCDEIRVFDNSLDMLHLVFLRNNLLELDNFDDYPYLKEYFGSLWI